MAVTLVPHVCAHATPNCLFFASFFCRDRFLCIVGFPQSLGTRMAMFSNVFLFSSLCFVF